MQSLPVCFGWLPDPEGYRWLYTHNQQGVEDLYLVGNSEQKSYETEGLWLWPEFGRASRPMTPAFLRFAELHPAFRSRQFVCWKEAELIERIPAFAKEYGRLGLPQPVLISAKESSSPMPVGTLGWYDPRGEAFKDWAREVGIMRLAVTLLELCQARDSNTLSHYFSWSERSGHKRVLFSTCPDEPVVADLSPPYTQDYRAKQLWDGDFILGERPELRMAATSYVVWLINEQVSRHVRVRFVQGERGVLEWHFVPHCLLGALWLQFAFSIKEGKEQGRCAICGDFYEIAAGDRPKRRRYCSSRCRTRNHRESKQGIPRAELSKRPTRR